MNSIPLATISRAGAALSLSLMVLAGTPSLAQPTMAPPPCQCSTPTPVPALSMTVVHCLCGGVSCVLSESTGGSKTGAPLMQCVK